MSAAVPDGRGPVAVDTNVLSSRLVHSKLAEGYASILAGRELVASFITDAEIRFGARRDDWGEPRLQRLDVLLAAVNVVQSTPELTEAYVTLRTWCKRNGHGLAGKVHEADRWIAATALWLDVPLVTHDRIFLGVEGLDVLTMLDD